VEENVFNLQVPMRDRGFLTVEVLHRTSDRHEDVEELGLREFLGPGFHHIDEPATCEPARCGVLAEGMSQPEKQQQREWAGGSPLMFSIRILMTEVPDLSCWISISSSLTIFSWGGIFF